MQPVNPYDDRVKLLGCLHVRRHAIDALNDSATFGGNHLHKQALGALGGHPAAVTFTNLGANQFA